MYWFNPYSFSNPVVQLGMKFDDIKSESKVLHVVPFNSEKKRGGVAIKRVIIMIMNLEHMFFLIPLWC